jgi:FlaA1/EpsC-like NDP-sugar epimerase
VRIFITGMSGTLGSALAKLHYSRGDQVWGCSRSESRAVEWLASNSHLATLFLTDASALANTGSDVGRLLPSMDRVYHTAAMKHVDRCEQQPIEAFEQNTTLTEIASDACRATKVEMVLISSDKACNATNVYGASKLLAERIAIRDGHSVIRLGNLVGSSGSVFSFWRDAVKKREPIKVTDPEMTRFFIGVDDAAKFVADNCWKGRVAIPNPLLAVRMGDVANAIGGSNVQVIGPRPGETRHQWLVAPGESFDRHKAIVLGKGDVSERGICSETAERWKVVDLLSLAGIGCTK